MANDEELGCLWTKEKNGKVYMTGTINGVQIVCFQNTYRKEGSNQPHWRVFRARAKGERPTSGVDMATGADRSVITLRPVDDEDPIPF